MKTKAWIVIATILAVSCTNDQDEPDPGSAATDGPIIETFAGKSTGEETDTGSARDAKLGWVTGVALDASGNLYIADGASNTIRKVNSSNIISTVAGKFRGWNIPDTHPWAGDGGPATAAKLNTPIAVAVDVSGNIFICDVANHVIRKVNSAGVISTIAGNPSAMGYSGDNGPATQALIINPQSIITDTNGNVYFSDTQTHNIRKISTDGIITTIAGTPGEAGYSGDGGPATAAKLNMPSGLAFDTSGNMYVCDQNAVIRRISVDGKIRTIAGTGVEGFSGDGGKATEAQLYFPKAIAIAPDGSIVIADAANNRIRRIAPETEKIETVAGNGEYAYKGDLGAAIDASIANPWGVAVDAAGNIYVAETGSSVVRIIKPVN